MEKKKKIILIVSLSVASAVVTYFAGGLVATHIVINNMIDVRGSDENSLQEENYQLQYNRSDYPLLASREELTFKCGKTDLQGYYYKVDNSKGLVMIAHGINSLADGSMSQLQNYFVEKGWSVFSFDMIGCGRSGGKGMKSLYESRICIDAALKAYKSLTTNDGDKLCLIGHSWGGYGSLTVGGFDAVAAFSAYNQPNELMCYFAEHNVSSALVVTEPGLNFALSVSYGQSYFKKASDFIKKNKDTKYFLVQGDKDDVVPLKKYSAYSHVDENKCDNVTKILLEGMGHNSPWKSLEGEKYLEGNVKVRLAELHKQYGEELPKEVFEEFLTTVDKEKSSELNTSLLDLIENMFINS